MSFPEDSRVETRYPLVSEQEHGAREAWPGLPGWVVSVCRPGEWEICVQEPSLGRLEDGSIPGPEVPEAGQFFPVCFRDSSELRAPEAEPPPEAEP
ncbi:MAG: hypothetical protein ACRDOH_33845 [Streptosporangiaceae bacterium]